MSFIDVGPEFDTETGQRDSSIPEFFTEAVHNNARSEKEGRPCFDEVEFVRILIPGDLKNTPVQILTDKHKKRWPRHYAAWKSGQEEALDGTPIDQLPGMTKAQAQELRHFHIRTIEQLANMPDDLLMKAQPMSGRPLRERAQRWVAATEGSASEERLAAENRELREKMGLMEKDQAELRAAVDRLSAASPKAEA